MSSFSVVSDGVVVSVGLFEVVSALAAKERIGGRKVSVRRSTPAEVASMAQQADNRGWAVEVEMANRRDFLLCLDGEDAHSVLREVRGNGVNAQIVRV